MYNYNLNDIIGHWNSINLILKKCYFISICATNNQQNIMFDYDLFLIYISNTVEVTI